MSHRPIAASLLMCALGWIGGTAVAEAAVRTWKAFPIDNLWSNPANWEEGTAPVDGDEIRFPQTAVQPATVVNDIVNLRVQSLRTTGNFTIDGQPFTILNSVSADLGTAVYNVQITASGDTTWTMTAAQITLNTGLTLGGGTLTSRTSTGHLSGTLRVAGVLSGNGTLIVTGVCVLELPNANTYTGPTIINSGTVRLGHPSSLGAGDGTIANGTIVESGTLDFLQPLVLANELIETKAGGPGLFSTASAVTLTGGLRLKGETLVTSFPAGLHLAGPLELTGLFLDTSSNQLKLPQVVVPGEKLDLTDADLSVILPEGFQPAMGQAFTIADVWGTTPITGTFNGLPEGASFTASGVKFAISYAGATGNDIVLTVVGIDLQYYLSEGATGSFFSTDILLANPNATAAPVTVTFLKSGGAAPIQVTQTLPAWSRRTVHVDDINGLEEASFSTIVRSDDALPIMVERTMSWDQTGYGSHTEKAITGPSKTWYFAEGTQGFFYTYVLLANPHPAANSATVRYLLEGGPAISRTYTLDPESRFTIDIGADTALRNQTFGMEVTFDVPGIAERAMYFGTSPFWTGGHDSVGVTAPSTSWFLAEGATGSFFETFVLLANPNARDVTATVDFLTPSGNTVTKTKVIPANGRLTLNIEQEDPALASTPVATAVTATLPIIVERSQYWPDPASQWYEAHNSFGVTAVAKKWGLAEGRVGGADNAQTYILFSAPFASGSVKVTFLRESGVPVQKTFNLGFGSRFTLAVGAPDVPEIVNERFGVLIESSDAIAVERALYWDNANLTWAAGSNATATRLP